MTVFAHFRNAFSTFRDREVLIDGTRRWTFRDLPPEADGPRSLVEFYIAYEFRSRMLALVMGSMFDAAFRKFAAAFEKRADEIYGKRAGA